LGDPWRSFSIDFVGFFIPGASWRHFSSGTTSSPGSG
jgi:hypothetical protein